MKATLTISDMECPTCTHFLEMKVGALPGVKHITTNLKKRSLKLEFDETQLSLEQVVTLITRFGYHPTIEPKPA
jgi:copper chaperone CopZ